MRTGSVGKLTQAAAALYRKEQETPSNPFLAAVAAVSVVDCVEVWPENWQSFDLFVSVGTQWRIGMAGPTGLDYSALYPLLDRLPADEWQSTFDDVRIMERAALDAMHEKD